MDYEISDPTTGTHSAVASRMVEQAIGDSPRAYRNSELAAALHSLKDMVAKVEDVPSSTEAASQWALEEAAIVKPPTEAEIDKLVQKAEGRSIIREKKASKLSQSRARWLCGIIFQV